MSEVSFMCGSKSRTLRVVVLAGLAQCALGAARAADCNQNGLEDALDIARGTSADCNRSGTPDECDVGVPDVSLAMSRVVELDAPQDLLAVGDFNGDGAPDLITADSDRHHVIQLFKNNGGHGYSGPSRMSLPETLTSVASGDLDGDGDLDLAIAVDFGVLFAWNDGTGELVLGPKLPVGPNPISIVVADLDGDRDLDLATANFLKESPAGDNVSIFLNQGKGAFEKPVNLATHTGWPDLSAKDFDGDGDLDLAVTVAGEGTLTLLENDGAASFLVHRDDQVLANHISGTDSIAFGDLDGDGDLDGVVVVRESAFAGGGQRIVLLTNDGSLFFGASYRPERFAVHGEAVITDLDGDGDNDIVLLGDQCIEVVVVFNDGKDGFRAQTPFNLERSMRQLVLADLDGAGQRELVGVTRYSVDILLRSPGRGGRDCNSNGIPDECEADCNANGIPDDCDIAQGADDCDRNQIPDECEADCNRNGAPDECDIASGVAADCNLNGVPDSCELAAHDCDLNGSPDDCDVRQDPRLDCDASGMPDGCEARPRFATAEEEYATGYVPICVGYGDLDGDGDIDLVTADLVGRTVTVLENTGPETFARARVIAFAGDVLLVQPADLDGDGRADLVVLGENSSCLSGEGLVTTFMSQGNLSFTRRAAYAVGSERVSSDDGWTIAAARMNGDRAIDLVIGTVATTWLLLGKGDGTFQAPQLVAESSGRAEVVDLDRDGDPDIAFSGGEVLLNDGSGEFQEGVSLPLTGFGLASGDLDGDGDNDLIVDRGAVLLNRGDATFEPKGTLPTGGWSAPRARVPVRLLDIDGDHDLDVAIIPYGAVWVAENLGGAQFGPLKRYASGEGTIDIAAVDIDQDGDIDLIACNEGSDSVSILRNDGRGTFLTRDCYAHRQKFNSLVAADFDGDRDLDLAALSDRSDTGTCLLLENDGNGSYAHSSSFRLSAGERGASMATADVDGDGDADLCVATYGDRGDPPRVVTVLNSGAGQFTALKTITAKKEPSVILAADVDGDSDQDFVILSSPPDSFSVLLNQGDGTFGEPTEFELGYSTDVFCLADVDGDHDLDVITNRGLEIVPWNIVGEAQFQIRIGIRMDRKPICAVAGDFDEDGSVDLAFGLDGSDCRDARGAFCTSGFEILFGAGGGSFRRKALHSRPWVVTRLVAADMDRDGHIDLVAFRSRFVIDLDTDNQIEVLLNRGAGVFQYGGDLTVGAESKAAAVGDLDGDGLLDLAVAALTEFRPGDVRGTGDAELGISVILNRTRPPLVTDLDRDGVPDSCQRGAFRRGDVDESGRVDLADAIAFLHFLFLRGEAIECRKAADANDDGKLNITDAIRLLGHLFGGQGGLPEPFAACGLDPTVDSLSCEAFTACR